jgi:hypothetical protein
MFVRLYDTTFFYCLAAYSRQAFIRRCGIYLMIPGSGHHNGGGLKENDQLSFSNGYVPNDNAY